jgi:hypothetical protein
VAVYGSEREASPVRAYTRMYTRRVGLEPESGKSEAKVDGGISSPNPIIRISRRGTFCCTR